MRAGGSGIIRALWMSAPLALWCICALAGGACLSGSQAFAGDAANPDEALAFVEGETITRRMVIRSLGERAEDQSEQDYERSVRSKLYQRVVRRVLLKAGVRFGLKVPPDALDAEIEKEGKREVAEARAREEARKPGSGASITLAKVLADRGESMEEFREQIRLRILESLYWYVLENGLPGRKAPQVDFEPTPAELERLYAAHRADLGQQAGVRTASFVLRLEDQSLAQASSRLAAVFADMAAGMTPEAAGLAHGVKVNAVTVSPRGVFLEKEGRGNKAAAEWLFDPARAKGDTKVLEVAGGLVVGYAVLETRAAKPRTYEEVVPELILLVKETRRQRFELRHTLECLASATIQPPELAQELQADIRSELKRLDTDPVRKDIRLR